MKLLLALGNIPDESLVLIDELELAIHPKAQMQLFHYLTKFSKQKKLTIIFSTHSVTLIKGTDRKHILFLQNSNGIVHCHRECYPTFALGHITSGEEVAPDCVVYVEDDSGKKCLTAILEVYREKVAMKKRVALPTTLSVPLGGFSQILEFLDKAPQMLPTHTKLVAMLDGDVQTDSLAEYEANDDHQMLDLFKRLKGKLYYLPWTPEVGLVQLIRADIPFHENQLKEYFSDNRISVAHDWAAEFEEKAGATLRKYCKKVVYELGHSLEKLLGKSNDRIREDLFRYLVSETERQGIHDLTGLIAKAIH